MRVDWIVQSTAIIPQKECALWHKSLQAFRKETHPKSSPLVNN